ncbi:hypothetical protein IT417_01975 [bacterium]|nr:hypothetical protein [bacterium]
MNIPIPKTSSPAQRAFDEVGIKYLEDFCKFTIKELLVLHGVGPKAIRILNAELKKYGLDFKKAKS